MKNRILLKLLIGLCATSVSLHAAGFGRSLFNTARQTWNTIKSYPRLTTATALGGTVGYNEYQLGGTTITRPFTSFANTVNAYRATVPTQTQRNVSYYMKWSYDDDGHGMGSYVEDSEIQNLADSIHTVDAHSTTFTDHISPILKTYPEYINQFTSAACTNIQECCPSVLTDIIQRDPASAHQCKEALTRKTLSAHDSRVDTLFDNITRYTDHDQTLYRAIANNIHTLKNFLDSGIGEQLLNEASRDTIVQAAIENVGRCHPKTLHLVLKQKPEAAQQFITELTQQKLQDHPKSAEFLAHLIQQCPPQYTALEYAFNTLNNYLHFSQNNYAGRHTSELSHALANNVSIVNRMGSYSSTRETLFKIISNDTALQNVVANYILQKPLVCSVGMLNTLIPQKPEITDQVAETIANASFDDIHPPKLEEQLRLEFNFDETFSLLLKHGTKNTNLFKAIIKLTWFIQDVSLPLGFHNMEQHELAKAVNDRETLEIAHHDLINSLHRHHDYILRENLQNIADHIVYQYQVCNPDKNIYDVAMEHPRLCSICPEHFLNYCHTTPTEQHTIRYADKITRKIPSARNTLSPVFRECGKKALEESLKGRYTFFHAQEWHWHAKARIFKYLWRTRYGEDITDYQFLRFLGKPSKKEQEEAKRLRESIMAQGRTDTNRPHILFANAALFGNINQRGSCSAKYFSHAHDLSRIDFSCDELFTFIGLPQALYNKYSNELEAVLSRHEQLNQHGNMLLISMNKEQVKQMTYPASPGGAQCPVYVFSSENNNIKNTSSEDTINTRRILETIRKRPENTNIKIEVLSLIAGITHMPALDRPEYCIPLSREDGGALDPYNGPRIYAFHPTDPDAYKQWEHDVDHLFTKIEADYKSGNY